MGDIGKIFTDGFQAISFTLTCSLDSECEFNAPMNLEQQSICTELLWAMVTNNLPIAPMANQWDGDEDNEDTEKVGDDDDDNEGDEGDSPQNTQIADLPSLFQQQVQVTPQPESQLPSKQVFVCLIIQPIITQLFLFLVTHLPSTATDGKWFNLFLPFIALASIRNKGEFIPSGQIMQIISAVLFLLHLTMFNLIDTHVTNNPTERYEASIFFLQSMTSIILTFPHIGPSNRLKNIF